MLLQLVTVVTTTSASTEVDLSLLPPAGLKVQTGFFTDMSLDAAMWDAFAEAILALTVFGAASWMMRTYRGKTSKTAAPSKSKASLHANAPWAGKKTARNCTDMASGRAERREGVPAPGPVSSSQTASKEFSKISEADAVASAVRAGKASQLPQILDAALARALAQGKHGTEQDVSSQLLLTALRSCAAVRRFDEGILAYDHLAGRIGGGSAGLWSVLLYSVVEAGAFKRCKYVFENLIKNTSPSGHDFVNMVKCHVGQHDVAGLREMLGSLRRLGHSIDAYSLNRSLAACSASDSVLDLADELAGAGVCTEGIDAVGYNTLMKYNARAGRISRCFQLRTEMSAHGIQASEVTFGILLDACVSAQELDRAREVFNDLCASGLQLNVVHCTSFMKVLVSARRLDEAAGVLREMVRSPGVKPDLITYSTLVKAYAEGGHVSSALKVLELMLSEGVKADEIIFNTVLSCCSTFPMKSSLVMYNFETLIRHGMKPTTTTLSILLKSLAHTDAWSMSLQVLQDSPRRFGLEPELRLYAQLVQACIKAHQAKAAPEVFEAMLKAARRHGQTVNSADIVGAGRRQCNAVTPADSINRCLRSCMLANEHDVAAQFWRILQREEVPIDASMERMFRASQAKVALSRTP